VIARTTATTVPKDAVAIVTRSASTLARLLLIILPTPILASRLGAMRIKCICADGKWLGRTM
jgi:hypothetical protein